MPEWIIGSLTVSNVIFFLNSFNSVSGVVSNFTGNDWVLVVIIMASVTRQGQVIETVNHTVGYVFILYMVLFEPHPLYLKNNTFYVNMFPCTWYFANSTCGQLWLTLTWRMWWLHDDHSFHTIYGCWPVVL